MHQILPTKKYKLSKKMDELNNNETRPVIESSKR